MAKANTPAVQDESGVLATAHETFDLTKAKLKQRLVMPTISIAKMKEGDVIYLRADSELMSRQQTDDKGEPKMKDGKSVMIDILNATDMNTGEVGQVVVPAVAKRGFEEAAKQEPLTGRFFAMKKGRSTGANKANLWEVVEFTMGQ